MKTGWKTTPQKIKDHETAIRENIIEIEKLVNKVHALELKEQAYDEHFRSVDNRITNLNTRMQDLHDLEVRVEKITCLHPSTKLEYIASVISSGAIGSDGMGIVENTGYVEVCNVCHAKIREISEEEYLAEEIQKAKAHLDSLVEKAKEIK